LPFIEVYQVASSRTSPRTVLIILLVATTISLSAYAAAGTINYYQFYPALTKLRVDLTYIQWNASSTSLNGSVVFEVNNPTSYSGLRLRSLQSLLEVVLNDTNAIPQGSFSPLDSKGSLDPGKMMSLPVSFRGSGAAPLKIIETQASGGVVKFDFLVNLTLQSFLDPAALIVVSFLCETVGGPANCPEAAITLYSRGIGLPGPGPGGV